MSQHNSMAGDLLPPVKVIGGACGAMLENKDRILANSVGQDVRANGEAESALEVNESNPTGPNRKPAAKRLSKEASQKKPKESSTNKPSQKDFHL